MDHRSTTVRYTTNCNCSSQSSQFRPSRLPGLSTLVETLILNIITLLPHSEYTEPGQSADASSPDRFLSAYLKQL